MKTFTVRQLDREPQTVLKACDKDGAVEIRRRDGRTYVLRPTAAREERGPWPEFAARRRTLFPKPLSKKFARALDKLIAGE